MAAIHISKVILTANIPRIYMKSLIEVVEFPEPKLDVTAGTIKGA